ncbi:hypothetical protein LVJ94_15475 [Pendulispora rubella]|uniref:Membrane protein 6-pyruvoyl-tetrahydropterin synthase-related domain-containing protein n=1 Tax=Pendulispora rubella TaxID=2741070 RepID=A0ABZ2LCH3_9BACT
MATGEVVAKLAEERIRAVLGVLRTYALRVWNDERLFLFALCVMNLFFARRTFGTGIWVDNDSICHYAYVRHLIEDFYPATGTYMGWSPKFNLGIPYLLYNTPPLLYVVIGATAKLLGISALASLKTWIVTAFLSVPLLGYALAQTFDDEPGDLPKFTAITLSLFSSELFGLEFYFKNGMLNPAFAVPLMMGTLVAFRRAQQAPMPRAFVHLAWGSVVFAACVMTHLLTTYMMCLALAAFVLGAGPRKWGSNTLMMGVLIGTGVAITGEWLYPSLKFAAKTDAAYTWTRPAFDTISDWFEGSLISSYRVGFFPSFFTYSTCGMVAIVAGFVGIVELVRRRNGAVAGCLITFVLAFWVALGPEIHAVIDWLPMYQNLLWYRFITLAILAWLLVAAYGAWRFANRKFRYYPLNMVILAAGAIWAFFVMTQRAVKVYTADEFSRFEQSVEEVAGWLRDHGDKRGRVFGEFLGEGAVQPPSVNYVRHMIPVLSGFREISGWIYENNPASQVLQKKGPFWHTPFPVINEAETYDVKYIVAGTPHFIHALTKDPRWRSVMETPDIVLFERVGYEPRMLTGEGYDSSVTVDKYLPGGGYQYEFDVTPTGQAGHGQQLLVKTNFSPAWRAWLGDRPLDVHENADGLILLDLPEAIAAPAKIKLVWDITDLRAKGRKVTFAGLSLALLLLGVGSLKRTQIFQRIPQTIPQAVGTAGLVLATAGFAWHARHLDLSKIGLGIADGLMATADPNKLEVGAYHDEQESYPVHVLHEAWGKRELAADGQPFRTLSAPSKMAVYALFDQDGGQDGLLVTGQPVGAPIQVEFVEPAGGTSVCTLAGSLGSEISVPPSCLVRDPHSDAPGVERFLRFQGDVGTLLKVERVEVKNRFFFVQAESFRNVALSKGRPAFYSIGAVDYFASNGSVMVGDAKLEEPISLRREVDLPQGLYTMWACIFAVHERFRSTRALVNFDFGGQNVGAVNGVGVLPLPFWNHDVQFGWVKVGDVVARGGTELISLTVKKEKGNLSGLFDLDVVAFVPRGQREQHARLEPRNQRD